MADCGRALLLGVLILVFILSTQMAFAAMGAASG